MNKLLLLRCLDPLPLHWMTFIASCGQTLKAHFNFFELLIGTFGIALHMQDESCSQAARQSEASWCLQRPNKACTTLP